MKKEENSKQDIQKRGYKFALIIKSKNGSPG